MDNNNSIIASEARNSVVFTTPGELPEIAITTLGINAKDEANDSPIGFFGTGLKYAIAILLRESQQISIHSTGNTYSFATEDISLRGKDFAVVTMRCGSAAPQRLGFTTELGKNWKLWMAYRELYSNTMDEGGNVGNRPEESNLFFDEPTTRIVVTGAAFSQIHANHRNWFLASERRGNLLVRTANVEIYDAPAAGLFYRNILVHEEPTLFTYNFLGDLELTEDRTIRSMWVPRWWAGMAITNSNNEKLIVATVCAPHGIWDHRIDFDNYDAHSASRCPTFYRVLAELYDNHTLSLRGDVKLLYLRHRPVAEIQPTLLSKLEQAMLRRALAALATLSVEIPPTMPIVVTETLGKDILGEAKNGTIYLARRAFQMGTKTLAGTIFEEWLHLTHHHSDCTRGMQNYLIDKIMSLAEELRGEPL